VSDLSMTLAMIIPALIWHTVNSVARGAAIFAALRAVAMVLLVYLVRKSERSAALVAPAPALFERKTVRELYEQARPFAASALFIALELGFYQFIVANHFGAAAFAVFVVGTLNRSALERVYSPGISKLTGRMMAALAVPKPPITNVVEPVLGHDR